MVPAKSGFVRGSLESRTFGTPFAKIMVVTLVAVVAIVKLATLRYLSFGDIWDTFFDSTLSRDDGG